MNNEAKGTKIIGATSLQDMVNKLKTPRKIMLLVKGEFNVIRNNLNNTEYACVCSFFIDMPTCHAIFKSIFLLIILFHVWTTFSSIVMLNEKKVKGFALL